MLEIDGSRGEGGGQILRTALALSIVTGAPMRVDRIRAGRARPGLGRQHLAAVRAAAAIATAQVEGDVLGSTSIVFRPRAVTGGSHAFRVGSAGSAMLVLETILPALVLAEAPTDLELHGGTHNPAAPPFEFVRDAFLPLVGRMGPRVTATLERHGFHPGGGGLVRVRIEPVRRLDPLALVERGPVLERHALSIVARLPERIARREINELERLVSPDRLTVEIRSVESPGPGNALVLAVRCESVTEVFSGFGARGLPAEAVAARVADPYRRWIEGAGAVGPHLADQLMLPLALAGEGCYTTGAPTPHALTNAEVIGRFLPAAPVFRPVDRGCWEVRPR